ncbi:MAG: NAD(P)/FAD-dependent oxidoreductase [Alphaproteobacteria bacterium]|nr:NAD(P)/FAD-dependent oxidoreductase [Alphaproteobacteria bacterium]
MAADGPHFDTVIVGAGQGGLAVSYFLRELGIGHVVLERSSIASSWRERRWDSFCTVTPSWSIALPGAEYAGDDPDGFLSRDDLVRHFERWAESFDAPVRCGVEVRAVRRSGDGFEVETSEGVYSARNVVVATGTYQAPHVRPVAERLPRRLKQLAADDYKRPDMLAPGGVLVVGAGQTGCHIAEELHAAGRDVWLSVGRAGRLPRRWRGRDCIAWQRDMGYLDRTPAMLESPELRFRADPHLTGRNGGYTLSLHDLHRRGIRLLGRLTGCESERAHFDGRLHEEMRFADEFCEKIAADFDRHIAEHGIDAPPPTPEELAGGPPEDGAMPEVLRELDLAGAGIASVVWAAGYRYDFSWLEAPVLDETGYPVVPGGVSACPGLYFVGLNWMTWRKSGILYGVGDDARSVARHLAGRCRAYSGSGLMRG